MSKIFPTESGEITRDLEGYTDEDSAQWVEGGDTTIAYVEIDIQPQSGTRRAMELETEYESDYVGYIDLEDIEIPEEALTILGLGSYEQSVKLIDVVDEIGTDIFEPGDKVTLKDPEEDSEDDKEYNGREFRLVFPGNWDGDFEFDLEEL
ncbi:MAG: hypothetical protein ACOC2F_04495 [Bacteroidota bacterium]